MAYGTATIPRVDKIFGPGNAYVTQAKLLAQLAGVPIDMPAGPSELLIIADTTCNPAFVAADLLSQAEHGPDSQVVLIAISSTDILEAVDKEIKKLLATLPRQAIARKALAHSVAVCVEDAAHAIALANAYAPEHLSLQLANPNQWLGTITNAGSVFVGHWSAEAFGDYATGPNHTLPTSGYARSYSGLSVHSFMRSQSVQWVHRQGVPAIAPAVATLAACEGLDAHRIAAQLRLDAFEQPGFPSIDGSQQ
jgi:histidinol dehydrogenase